MFIALHIATVLYTPSNVPMSIKPYSSWSAFQLDNVREANKLISPQFEVVPISLYKGMRPKYMLLYNSYYTKSNLFDGHRLEVNVIGRHKKLHTTHFFVLKCLTNTLQWDPKEGVQWPNANSKQTVWPDKKKNKRFLCDVESFAENITKWKAPSVTLGKSSIILQ